MPTCPTFIQWRFLTSTPPMTLERVLNAMAIRQELELEAGPPTGYVDSLRRVLVADFLRDYVHRAGRQVARLDRFPWSEA